MSINSFLAIWKWKNSHKSRKKLSINSLKFLIHPFEHLIWDGSFECPQHMFYLRIKKIMSNYTLLSVKCLFMHAWIQEVLSAGGIQAWRPENSLNNAFFLSPQLILQFTEGVKWFYYRETILFQGSRGGPTFTRGGVQLFPRGGGGGGGPNANFYRNPYNLWFSRGGPYSLSPPSGSAHVMSHQYTVKPVLSSHSKEDLKICFHDRKSHNAGKKYCRMLWSILQYFPPALRYHLSLRPLFCIYLSGHFRQVSLYKYQYQTW